MLVDFTDYNNAANLINTSHQQLWTELEQAFQNMPLFLKSSAQASRQGDAIFDPIATNSFLFSVLSQKNWQAAYPMPAQFDFLGTDIDFAKSGTLVEVQFSNYPYLLNNVLRAEMLYKSRTIIQNNTPANLLILVTKFNCLPASNSTLYYEQAVNQLNAMVSNSMLSMPIRLVGLHESIMQTHAYWTDYTGGVSSRTILNQGMQTVQITQSRSGKLKIV